MLSPSTTAYSKAVLVDSLIIVNITSLDQYKLFYCTNRSHLREEKVKTLSRQRIPRLT